MKTILSTLTIALLFHSAACGDDGGSANDAGAIDGRGLADARPTIDAISFDAHPANYDCLAFDGGTTAPNPIRFGGIVENLLSGDPVDGADVIAFLNGGGQVASSTSGDGGLFSLDIPTGGLPWEGYITAEQGMHIPMRIYPPILRDHLENVPLPFFTKTQLDVTAALAAISLDDGKGQVFAFIFDCVQDGVEGATVTFNPAPADGTVYIRNDAPATGLTATDPTGLGVGFNLDPGTVEITVNYRDETFQATVLSIADSVTIAIFYPQ